jgi:AraC-like DNA-binding protein
LYIGKKPVNLDRCTNDKYVAVRALRFNDACMFQFHLTHGSGELVLFPHILQFALRKSESIQFNSLQIRSADSLRLYYVLDGKFEWIIEGKRYILYPSDLAIVLPGKKFGSEKGFLDIGTVASMEIGVKSFQDEEEIILGEWSSLSTGANPSIGRMLTLHHTPVLANIRDAGDLFSRMQHELFNRQIGYVIRMNQLLDEMLILLARKLSKHAVAHRDFPQTFLKLEQSLRDNLAHQWTVEEMASLVGLGHTAFSEKVKNFTGFSPLNYLINIRISKAILLLQRQDSNVTDIALDTGFYSSQHFATTFKRLTGYSPSQFRKKNVDAGIS